MGPYSFILMLFTLAGLVMTFWGWVIIVRGKKTLRWPSVEGAIERSSASSEDNDILPKIVFSYRVADRRYERSLPLPAGSGVTPDFAESYVKKYPQGAKVRVHYNPERPDQATLEPGLRHDDWLVFAIGLLATVCGGGFLVFGVNGH